MDVSTWCWLTGRETSCPRLDAGTGICVPAETKGLSAAESRAKASEVSFIEQIGDAGSQPPSGFRELSRWRNPKLQNGAA